MTPAQRAGVSYSYQQEAIRIMARKPLVKKKAASAVKRTLCLPGILLPEKWCC